MRSLRRFALIAVAPLMLSGCISLSSSNPAPPKSNTTVVVPPPGTTAPATCPNGLAPPC